MSSLEAKKYVATLEDVARITRDVLEAHKLRTGGVATYLSSLIATTIAELGENPRQRAGGSTGKLSAEETAEQLAALQTVSDRFYAVVVKTAREKIDTPDKGGLILNKRTGFARSSLSTVRKWVRHGNDITSLVPGRTTKAALYIPSRRKGGPSPKVLGNRSRRFAVGLETALKALAAADRGAAVEEWERVKAHMDRILRNGREGGARVGVSRVARGSLQQAA